MVIVIRFTVRRAALAARDFWRTGPVEAASFGAYLASCCAVVASASTNIEVVKGVK